MDPKDRRVKIRQEEIDSLFNLKALIDDKEVMAGYAEKYQQLGWDLAALDAQDGTDLKVDFAARPEIKINSLWNPGLAGPMINLAVRTGKRSGIMVLQVASGWGELLLDRYGVWRAECVAALGTSREQHFYAWPPSPFFDSLSVWMNSEFKWFGEGQIVLAPPSLDPETREPWRWLCPPWEKRPQPPSQSVERFLWQHVTSVAQARPAVKLSWQEIYCLASPYQPLLQALSAASPLMEDYYQGIIQAAMEVGLHNPEVLLPLLWHAPRGDARQRPERWEYLKNLVLKAQGQTGPSSSQSIVPFALNLEEARDDDHAGHPGGPPAKPGPQGLSKRRLTIPPGPGTVPRNPFSNRKT
ncbi:MAG: hypothetical protein WBV23_03020 [Desulfobaccales bacterium]